MKSFRPFIFITIFLTSQFVYSQPCEGGQAGDYPCQLIDQLSLIPLFSFDAPNLSDVWGWTSPTTGKEYAILGAENKTAFLDVTTPEHPIYLGYLPTATIGSLWRDMKVIDNFTYIVSEASEHGMQIFDLTRLESLTAAEIPVEFDSDAIYSGFGNCHNIVADTANKFVYAVGTQTFAGGLHVIDVSNPLEPVFVGGSAEGGYCHDAQVLTYTGPDEDYQGREICLGFNADQVVIYDVTNKSDIEVISTSVYEDVGYVHQGWFTEDLNFMISNDETDELDFEDMNTRSIIWNMQDLDDPQVIEYVDLGTTSIDHNLYTHKDMLYESNYTTGLRVFDMLEVDQGHIEPFGYFDVLPSTDAPIFFGSWSNYPYFESGNIPVTNMYGSFHMVKPRFFELIDREIRVCDEESASMDILIHRRLFGTVNYDVQLEDGSIDAQLMGSTSDGAPAVNILNFSNLGNINSGYYPGEVTITHEEGEEVLPFVLIKEGVDELVAPELLFPVEGQGIEDQNVEFQFTDPNAGFGIIQVSLDELFANIVYEETFYGGESLEVILPLDLSTYYWRIVKPTACGDDVISEVESFIIDESFSTNQEANSGVQNLYPNPAVEHITITPNGSDAEAFEIYDVSGRLVLTTYFSGQTNRLDLNISDLNAGVYFVKARGEARAKKFVKQ